MSVNDTGAVKSTKMSVLREIADTLGARWHKEDLVVAAWKARPDLFGLGKYPQCPDSNAVYVGLYQKRHRDKDKVAEALGDGYFRSFRPPPPPDEFSDELAGWLIAATKSVAMRKHDYARQGGTSGEMTFLDATVFWGFTEATFGKAAVNACLARFSENLASCRAYLMHNEKVLACGRVVMFADTVNVEQLHKVLLKQFDRHLGVLRNRRKPDEPS